MKLPVPLVVIAWVIIAQSLDGIIALGSGLANSLFTSGTVNTGDLSLTTTRWAGAIALAVNLVLGCLILARFGWARIIYIAIVAIDLCATIFHPQPLALVVMSVLKIVVFGYFFFRPDSNKYFSMVARNPA